MIVLPKRSKIDVETHINIVPYIDVMLVLLVIFMMTTPIIEQVNVTEVDLPRNDAKAVDFSEQLPTIITVNRNGKYSINSMDDAEEDEKNLTVDEIAARVEARLEFYKEMKFYIRGNGKVAYETVLGMLNLLQERVVEKVGLIIEPAE
ncbi:MAG: protein TolR [Candidatus Thioglobus sp.]|nr:MAG: protein TolR [Candidatus Thioglobus sp.]